MFVIFWTTRFKQVPLIQHDGIMARFLILFDFTSVKIVLKIVSKAPTTSHIRVGVLKSEEIITAYPSLFIPVSAVRCVDEKLWNVIYVHDKVALVFALRHRTMCDGTPTSKKVNQPFAFWQDFIHNSFGNTRFASSIWYSVFFHSFLLPLPKCPRFRCSGARIVFMTFCV